MVLLALDDECCSLGNEALALNSSGYMLLLLHHIDIHVQ